MSKREITNVPAGKIVVPDFMKEHETAGLQTLKQYVTPRRVKVVQKSADSELLDQFFVGDIIVTPDNELVCEMERDDKGRPSGESDGFLFSTVFFFVEYCTWNPFELKGKAPAIIARSTDPHGAIARKAKNFANRYEPHPTAEGLKIRHVEHLNFICLINGRPDEDPVILTFDRGDHGAGRACCDLIATRRGPIYGGIYQATVNYRENEYGNWWGIDVSNPSIDDSEPWVDEERFPFVKDTHEYFAKLYADAALVVDYGNEESTDTNEF